MTTRATILLITGVAGHGFVNYPPSTRQGVGTAIAGSPAKGGFCDGYGTHFSGPCLMFSQPNFTQPKPTIGIIPGPPTLNDPMYRTVNVDVSTGPGDWTRIMPWRSPGAAPVLGSGCGVAGGGVWNANGGWPPPGMAQGADPLTTLPKGNTTVWKAGSVVEVAWGQWTNHGGGYSCALAVSRTRDLCPTHRCWWRLTLDLTLCLLQTGCAPTNWGR